MYNMLFRWGVVFLSVQSRHLMPSMRRRTEQFPQRSHLEKTICTLTLATPLILDTFAFPKIRRTISAKETQIIMDRSLDSGDEATSVSNFTSEEAVNRQHEEGASTREAGCEGINTVSDARIARSPEQHRRELNRLSKARCRKRRNDLLKKLEAEIARLSSEHNSLRAENEQLRQEFSACVGSNSQAPMITNQTRAETTVSNAVGQEFFLTDAFLPFFLGSLTNNSISQGVGQAHGLLGSPVSHAGNLGLQGHQAITLSTIAQAFSNPQP
jgi:cell division protein FtsB